MSYIIKNVPSSAAPLTKNLGQLLLDSMKKNHSKIVQLDPITNQSLTQDDVRKQSIRVALEMQRRGLKKNDVIMLCPKNHFLTQLPLLAGWYLGIASSTVSPMFTNNELTRIMKLVEPKMVFCEKEFSEKFAKLLNEAKIPAEIVTFQDDFGPFLDEKSGEDVFEAVDVDIENTNAVILCSSGTTGMMKGIPHTHKTLYHSVVDTEFVGEASDKMLTFSPLCWNSSVWFIVYCILYGNIRVAIEYPGAAKTLELLEKSGITFMNLNPTKLYDLIRVPNFDNFDLSKIRSIWSRGTVNTSDQMKLFREQFKNSYVLNAYGMTEICMMVTAFNPRNPEEVQMNVDKVYSNGKLCPGVEAKVVDVKTRKALPIGEKGELCIKAKSLMQGYYKNPEATSSAIDKEGWFATGDLVYFDQDGCLFIVGRLKEILKYKNFMITPSEMEYILHQHPEVQTSCVVGIPHPIDGDHPMAFVVKKTNSNITETELAKYVNDQVNEFQRLRGGIKFLDAMPMTGTGKVRRMELVNMAKELKPLEP